MAKFTNAAVKRPSGLELPSGPADKSWPGDHRPARRRRRVRAPARPRRADQCLGPLRAARPHRLRRRLAVARRTAAVQDGGDGRSTRKIITRNESPDICFDRSINPVSRLRARLRLLLRAADARLSRPLAGARFRIEAVRQAGSRRPSGKGTGGAGLRAARHRHRHQHRSVSADRAQIPGDAPHPRSARPRRPSRRHRHQVGAGAARPRHPCAHGRAQARQGGAVGDHARPQTRAHDGAARGDAERRLEALRAAQRRPACRPR